MQVLLLGGGAALHALAWKLLSEPSVERIFCAPGNAGTVLLVGPPPFPPEEAAEAAQWAFTRQVDLVVVQGMPAWVDVLEGMGLPVLGVGGRAWEALARREEARRLLRGGGVPCVEGRAFREKEAAERYLASRPLPLRLYLETAVPPEAVRVEDRLTAFRELERLFGLDSRAEVGIEEELPGVEVSLALLTDGKRALSLGVSRPYDRRYEGETGPLTEGMGAYAPYGDRALEERLLAEVGRPALAALGEAGLLRPAFLQLRILLGEPGPRLRAVSWGLDDLHAAVTLPRWAGEIAGLLLDAARGRLPETSPPWREEAAVALALVDEGYPGPCPEGEPLSGLYGVETLLFHHATRLQAESVSPASWLRPARPVRATRRVVTAGGRVLLVLGLAPTLEAARRKALQEAEKVHFPRCAWRRDIAAEEGRG
ncbi:MAG: phosphoribosylglycinamide synthetase C domain-containing protein [Chloroflexia bacterium]